MAVIPVTTETIPVLRQRGVQFVAQAARGSISSTDDLVGEIQQGLYTEFSGGGTHKTLVGPAGLGGAGEPSAEIVGVRLRLHVHLISSDLSVPIVAQREIGLIAREALKDSLLLTFRDNTDTSITPFWGSGSFFDAGDTNDWVALDGVEWKTGYHLAIDIGAEATPPRIQMPFSSSEWGARVRHEILVRYKEVA